MKLNFASLGFCSAALVSSLLVTIPARAVTTTSWNTNITFGDGATATGTFSYENSSPYYPIDANVTLNEGPSNSNTVVNFTSGDIGTTFSSFNTLILCSAFNTGNQSTATACATGASELVIDSINSFTSSSGSDTLVFGSPNGTSFTPAGGSPYYASGSGTAVSIPAPFHVPGGEGTVLLSSVLALGVIRRLKKNFSSTRVINPINSQAIS
jgi:hypothetical protein